jgi:hypothetical protein
MVLKINQKFFWTVCFSGNQQLALKGQLHVIFTSNFFFMNRPDSTVKNMLKIAEMKLSSCGLEVADIRKNCYCGIAKLQLRSIISLQSFGIAIAEVLPSSCGIAIADSTKSCTCPPLVVTDSESLPAAILVFG